MNLSCLYWVESLGLIESYFKTLAGSRDLRLYSISSLIHIRTDSSRSSKPATDKQSTTENKVNLTEPPDIKAVQLIRYSFCCYVMH